MGSGKNTGPISTMDVASFIRKQLTHHKASAAAVVAMGIKGVGALLTLAVFTLAARAMSAADFGRLAIWFSTVGFLGVAACYGQDTLIARSFGEYAGKGDYGLAWGAYRFGWIRIIASAGVFAAGMILLAPLVFPDVPHTAPLAAALFLLTQTCLHYSSHSTRAAVNFIISEVNRELVWRVVLLAVAIWALLHHEFTSAEFFMAGAAGQAISLGVQLLAMRRAYKRHAVRELREDHRAEWSVRARSMWLSAMVEGASLYFDVMLIGYFASPAVAGDYFAAARIAAAFILISGGLATYSFTHSANFFFSGQLQKLQDMLRSLVILVAVMAGPLLLLILVFGEQILGIFGPRYAGVYPTLVLLSAASFLSSLSGTPSVILLTTGHERLYARVITLATVLRMALTAALAAKFGAFGAALGWGFVNVPMSIVLAQVCRTKLGVDPSIAAIFHRTKRDMRMQTTTKLQ